MAQKLKIRQAGQKDLTNLWGVVEKLGHAKDVGYFERCLERQDRGDLLLLVASLDGSDIAYAILNWQPKYILYRRFGIPEIQDINVLHSERRKGFATQIIRYCENLAREKGKGGMGIAVSVHASFAPAQNLYIKLGYIPDGQGVTYDRSPVEFGSMKPVDDQLCLMLIKNLNP